MRLVVLALALTTATLFIRCTSLSSQKNKDNTSVPMSPPVLSTPLKAAIEELRVMKIKVEGEFGVNKKEYTEDLTDLINIVDKAYGDSKISATVRSAVKGHQLALQFWNCDQMTGYEQLHQCQDKVLKAVFVKYPDIEAQAKAAVEGENLPYISAGLDKDAVLQAIWQKTGEDTDAAVQMSNPASNPKEN